jgi:hypothetical protein
MISRLRRSRLALASVVLVALVVAGLYGAATATGASALRFTELHSGYAFAVPPPVVLTATCDPSGTSVITFSSTGQVESQGTFVNGSTFQVDGTITLGPQTQSPSWRPSYAVPSGPIGAVTAFQETFTVHYPDGRSVSGTDTLENAINPTDTFSGLAPDWFSWGICRNEPTAYSSQTLAFGVSSTFAATLSNPDGTTSSDAGVSLSFTQPIYVGSGDIVATGFTQFFGSGYVGAPDVTAPVAHPVQTPPPGPSGWSAGDVTVNWNWTDDRTGINTTLCDQSTPVSGSGTVTVYAWCYDNAGNRTQASYTVSIVKTVVTMGPQAMDGNLRVAPGSVLSAGYDFTMPGRHADATVQFVNGRVAFNATCADGSGAGSIVVPLADASVLDPADSSAWYPSGNPSSPATFQGQVTVPDLCHGGLVSLKAGGTFTSGIVSTDTTDKVNVRWHYADGGAGGWSGTQSVTPS